VSFGRVFARIQTVSVEINRAPAIRVRRFLLLLVSQYNESKVWFWINFKNGRWSQMPVAVRSTNIAGSIGIACPALSNSTISWLREGFGFSRIRFTR
jgi:hypothetical protein